LTLWRFTASGRRSRILTICIIAAVGGLILCAVLLNRGQYQQVVVHAWDRQICLTTRAATVGEALESANIKLSPGDLVNFPLTQTVQDGMNIVIERAEPVFVYCEGAVSSVLTAEKNVAKILELARIGLGPDDKVIPDLDATIPENRCIRVVRVTFNEVTVDEKVAFGTERREDRSLEAGLSRIYKEGVPGIVRVTYIVKYEDGREVSREEKAREEIKAPSSRIVLVGARHEISRGGESIRFERALEVTATAYCPDARCCGPYADGLTYTGIPAKKGVIAVDPRVIPLGTRVYVDGYGYAIAADVGGAIKGNKIDVCFDTYQEAITWGVKKVKVYILR